jgi:hypothetical protein
MPATCQAYELVNNGADAFEQGTCNGGNCDAADVGKAALEPGGWLSEALQKKVVHHGLEVCAHIIKSARQNAIHAFRMPNRLSLQHSRELQGHCRVCHTGTDSSVGGCKNAVHHTDQQVGAPFPQGRLAVSARPLHLLPALHEGVVARTLVAQVRAALAILPHTVFSTHASNPAAGVNGTTCHSTGLLWMTPGSVAVHSPRVQATGSWAGVYYHGTPCR